MTSARLVFRSVKFLSLCVLLGLYAYPGFAQEDDLLSLYQHAKTAEASGDYKGATADYEKIIRLRPDMAEAYANAGNLYYAEGESQKAEAYFRKAIALKPALPGPYFFLGLLSFKARHYTEALKSFRDAETRDSSNQIIESYLGYTQYALHNYEESVSHLKRAAASTPRDIDVFYHLSKAYAEVAKKDFRLLESGFPDSLFLSLATAHLYEAQQNWVLALREYQKAAAHHPSDRRIEQKLRAIEARKSSAQQDVPLAVDQGIDGALTLFYSPPSGDKVLEAIKAYEQQEEQLRTAKTRSAEQLYQLTEDDQALSYLASQWVFEIDPDSYRAHQLKGQYYEELNQDENAIAEYRKAVELNPQLPNVHFLIGNLYWRREKPDQAFPELRKELETDPSHPQALYELGDIYVSKNMPGEAAPYFLKAVQFEPGMEEAHLALARIYADENALDKAVAHLQKASALDPKDPTPHYRLSRVYQQAGKLQQSQAELAIFAKLRREQPAKNSQ
jgi:tetratricopeptide (TPR) repeat protein